MALVVVGSLAACSGEPSHARSDAAREFRIGRPRVPEAWSVCPREEPCRILPLGDSITFGHGHSGGYRAELFRLAAADGKRFTFVGSQRDGPERVAGRAFPKNHEGRGGWKIAQLRALLPTPALDELPHIVLLLAGANDLGQLDDPANAPARLGALLDALSELLPDALIVTARLTPFGARAELVTQFNDALPGLLDARAGASPQLRLVDMFSDFPASELSDGLHPDRAGYARMARVWYDAIRDELHSE